MNYVISDFVFDRVPTFRRAVISAQSVDNTSEPEELIQSLAVEQNRLRAIHPRTTETVAQAWQDAFVSVGMQRDVRPSIVSLISRVGSGTEIRFISPLVCISNLISLRFLLPSGPMDRDRLTGDLQLLPAHGDETFMAIGGVRAKSVPQGELVLFDTGTNQVICRGWNSRGSAAGMVTASTKRVVLDIDCLQVDTSYELHDRAVHDAVAFLEKYCAASDVTVSVLSDNARQVSVS